MPNIICWICKDNLVYKEYEETKLLDEEGNKPCFQCLLESQDLEENDDNEF